MPRFAYNNTLPSELAQNILWYALMFGMDIYIQLSHCSILGRSVCGGTESTGEIDEGI